jgi:co-chaperonin GroES (HSP10)
MPKSREQIKHEPVSSERWRPQRTQIGGLWFDPLKIQPLGNHILVVLDDEVPASDILVAPDVARNMEIGTRIGTVIAVGPGKLEEKRKWTESWQLNPLVFKPTTLKPGERVAIGHYSDWESWFCDYEGRGRNVVLCQEADARVLINAPIEDLLSCL